MLESKLLFFLEVCLFIKINWMFFIKENGKRLWAASIILHFIMRLKRLAKEKAEVIIENGAVLDNGEQQELVLK